MYFRTYGLPKTWLYKCLKRTLSEDSPTSNIVNRPKHCSKHSDSTFTIFIDPCERNCRFKMFQ